METTNELHDEFKIGCGLINIRNSCFFNATLQALFHTPALTDWFLKENQNNDTIKCECVICAVKTLFKDTKSNGSPYNPSQLYGKLQKTNKRFSKLFNGEQQDAHEFLKLFTEAMTNEKHSDLSFANKFKADIVTEVQCLTCKTIYKTTGLVGEFFVEIRGKQSVETALHSYFEHDSVDYDCIACKKKVLAKKRSMLLSAPDCLCITLNRFTNSNAKINQSIEITPDLNLSKYFCENVNGQWKCKLVTMINHIGRKRNKGHYTTLAYTENGCYKFDDSNVLNINEIEVAVSDAYILFYECYEEPWCNDFEEWIPIEIIDEVDTGQMAEDEPFLYMENEVITADENDGHSGLNKGNGDSDELIPIEIIGESNTGQTHWVENELHITDSDQRSEIKILGHTRNLIEDQSRLYMENEVNYSEHRNKIVDEIDSNHIGYKSEVNDYNIELIPESNIVEEENVTKNAINNESDKNEEKLSSCRIVDIEFLFKQMQDMGGLRCKSCYTGDMIFTKETKRGLISMLHFSCTICGKQRKIDSCRYKNKNQANPNEAAILGIVSIGLGFYHLQEFLAHFNIPCMSYQTFYSMEKVLQSDWWNLAKKLETEALLEEIRLAKECNEVDSAGNALIAEKCDGSWQKRSYGNNFSSLAGCAAIIGQRTNKIVYFDVKNKYCHTCKIAQSKNSPPNKHECNANYSGPSTGMENAIIVEGFKSCANKGARFHKFIGDGDSSTYKTLRDLRLYKNPVVYIDKYDCVNHVYKNFGKKFVNLETNTKFKRRSRKLISRKIGEDIVKGVRMAAKHYKESDMSLADKCTKLAQDCMNAPLHYFGIHDHCAEYFCTKTTTPQAQDLVTRLKNDGLYQEILNLCQHYFANKAKSLLAGFDNNTAESFNSIIAKILGGKRVNNALAGSYKSRTAIAAVHYNTRGHSASTFQQFKFGNSLPSSLNLENQRKRKVASNTIREKENPKKRRLNEDRTSKKKKKKGYGEGHEDVDLTPPQLELAKIILFEKLDEDRINRDDIQMQTRGQRYNVRWDEIRQNFLTSSYFGRVLNVRNRKSYQKIVEDILYHNFQYSNTAELNHQRLHELEALQFFCEEQKIESIDICGIFIDKKYSFLGASPFRLCGQDAIIIVKCPIKAWKMSISEAIDKNHVPYWTKSKSSGLFEVNIKSHWYFEIQGQLHISDKRFAYLVIYLGESAYKIESVDRNDDFWMAEMEKELVFFYNEAMVKEIVDSREARNMELRDYDTKTKTFI